MLVLGHGVPNGISQQSQLLARGGVAGGNAPRSLLTGGLAHRQVGHSFSELLNDDGVQLLGALGWGKGKEKHVFVAALECLANLVSSRERVLTHGKDNVELTSTMSSGAQQLTLDYHRAV